MDAIFVKGIHNVVSIDTELMDLFQTKGYAITEVQAIRITEGSILDMRTRVFKTTHELAKLISNCFRDTDMIERCMIHIDEESMVLFLLFTKSRDSKLPEFLTNIIEASIQF